MPTDQDSPLTQDQLRHFYRMGFLAIDRPIVPADEVAHIRGLLDGLFARFDELPKDLAVDLGDVKNHPGAQRTPQVNQASRFEPRLLETRYYQRAQAMARQLIGDDATMRWDHAILKPAHNQRETPWHQDLSYPARSSGSDRIIKFGCNMWLPLQETGVEGGCMHFIPHSHLGNLLPHHEVGHDPAVHTLEADDCDHSAAVACPLPPGGLTIHQPKTLHYTGPNRTDVPRHTWILFFGIDLPERL